MAVLDYEFLDFLIREREFYPIKDINICILHITEPN